MPGSPEGQANPATLCNKAEVILKAEMQAAVAHRRPPNGLLCCGMSHFV